MPEPFNTFSAVLGLLQSAQETLFSRISKTTAYPVIVLAIALTLIAGWSWGWSGPVGLLAGASPFAATVFLLVCVSALLLISALLNNLSVPFSKIFDGQAVVALLSTFPLSALNSTWLRGLPTRHHRHVWSRRHADFERWQSLAESVRQAISLVTAPVAARPLAPGEVISSSDLRPISFDFPGFSGECYGFQILGHTVDAPIPAGAPIPTRGVSSYPRWLLDRFPAPRRAVLTLAAERLPRNLTAGDVVGVSIAATDPESHRALVLDVFPAGSEAVPASPDPKPDAPVPPTDRVCVVLAFDREGLQAVNDATDARLAQAVVAREGFGPPFNAAQSTESVRLWLPEPESPPRDPPSVGAQLDITLIRTGDVPLRVSGARFLQRVAGLWQLELPEAEAHQLFTWASRYDIGDGVRTRATVPGAGESTAASTATGSAAGAAGHTIMLQGIREDIPAGSAIGFALSLPDAIPDSGLTSTTGAGHLISGPGPLREVRTGAWLPTLARGVKACVVCTVTAEGLADLQERGETAVEDALGWLQALRRCTDMSHLDRADSIAFQLWLRAATALARYLDLLGALGELDAAGATWNHTFRATLRELLPILHSAERVIASILTETHQVFRLEYPTHESEVASTAIGNILRATDAYAEDVYGIDATQVVARLQAVEGQASSAAVKAAADSLTLMEWSCASVLLVEVLGTLFALYNSHWTGAFFIWLVSGAGLWAVYEAAKAAAANYAGQLRILIDLHRGDLLVQLGVQLQAPMTVEQERRLWRDLTQRLEYGRPTVSYTIQASAAGGAAAGGAGATPAASGQGTAALR